MAGLRGCLPNVCFSCDSLESAVDSMDEIHELTSYQRQELKEWFIIDLDIHKFGNEYIEIVECFCVDQSIHNDI